MCREVEDAKEAEQGQEPSEDGVASISKPAMRSLEELKRDFLQRITTVEEAVTEGLARKQAQDTPVKAPTEVLAPKRAQETPAKAQKTARAERRSKAIPKPALPSLEQLERDFKQKIAARKGAAPTIMAMVDAMPKVTFEEAQQVGTLKKLVEGKGFGFLVPDGGGSKDVFLHFSDLVNGNSHDMVLGMRVSFTGEVDAKSGKTRARNASIVAESGGQETEGAGTRSSKRHSRSKGEAAQQDAKEDEAVCVGSEEPHGENAYSRAELLKTLRLLRGAGENLERDGFPIRTVLMPRVDVASQRRSARYSEDPLLDDEDLLGEMEERLSRESGFDSKNFETFGDCAGGWSFEQALEANERLTHRSFASKPSLDLDLALLPMGLGLVEEEEQRFDSPELVMQAVRRSMYTAVALQLIRSPKDPERCLSPTPSSADLEHCESTAASSGSATPSADHGNPNQGSEEFAGDRKECWATATTCYQ